MKLHTRIYFTFFGYSLEDSIPCEIPECKRRAVDINHIYCRGAGGSKTKDFIENLMGTCREHHEEYGDKKEKRQQLIEWHKEFMLKHNSKCKFDYSKFSQ